MPSEQPTAVLVSGQRGRSKLIPTPRLVLSLFRFPRLRQSAGQQLPPRSRKCSSTVGAGARTTVVVVVAAIGFLQAIPRQRLAHKTSPELSAEAVEGETEELVPAEQGPADPVHSQLAQLPGLLAGERPGNTPEPAVRQAARAVQLVPEATPHMVAAATRTAGTRSVHKPSSVRRLTPKPETAPEGIGRTITAMTVHIMQVEVVGVQMQPGHQRVARTPLATSAAPEVPEVARTGCGAEMVEAGTEPRVTVRPVPSRLDLDQLSVLAGHPSVPARPVV